MRVIANFKYLISKLPQNSFGDSVYFLIYFLYAHRRLPSRNKKLFNDYLYFHKKSDAFQDIYSQMTSDKALVKLFASYFAPEIEFPKTLLLTDSVKQLKKFIAPQKCVVKPTHYSAVVFFLEKGESLNSEQLDALVQVMKLNLYVVSRERNYRFLRSHTIIENCVLDDDGISPDYKVFCYQGKPKIIQVDTNRQNLHRQSFYTPDWKQINITYIGEKGSAKKPLGLDKMLKYSQILAQHFEFVRVDFYLSGEKVYLGELTHCANQAHGKFASYEDELKFSKVFFE